jgi:hypothetical protein
LYKLVKDLLVKQSITRLNEDGEQEESIIHGQMIITAKNPAPYIKRALSKCTIIKVNDMDTIIEKLGVPDELILEDKIEKDLIIIPSSVHEVILIPKDNEISDEEINEMIGEVNENELETVEILSNHMYLYCRRDDRIYM